MRRHRRLHVALLLTLLALGGCAGPAGTPGTPGTPWTPGADRQPTVTVVRSGGFAGVQETTTVRPDGEWTRTDRAGAGRTGRLTAEQESRLRELLTDPQLTTEAQQPPASGDTGCADTFTYQVGIDDLRVNFSDCPTGGTQPETAKAIVALVESATSG